MGVHPGQSWQGAWHVPACMGDTSSEFEVATSAVPGVTTGADASIMSVSTGMAGMLGGICCWDCQVYRVGARRGQKELPGHRLVAVAWGACSLGVG